MPDLSPAQRRALRARAHHLDPVVAIGQQGLTPAVLREIDVALKAHELIKVRAFVDDRAAREALQDEICATLDAAPVQHLGKLLVLWRPNPEKSEPGGTRERARSAQDARPRQRTREEPRASGRAPKPSGVAAGPRRGRSSAAAPPSGVPRAALPRRRRARV